MAESGRIMAGLTAGSLKKHPSLIPLLVCLGGGSIMAFAYTMRLATRNPDVTWDRKNNPYPWQKYEGKQYKFYAPLIDYKKASHPPERPDI
jgi:NADH dehydrogenase (ubiquinone) 1 alpha subcomplex subunit 4